MSIWPKVSISTVTQPQHLCIAETSDEKIAPEARSLLVCKYAYTTACFELRWMPPHRKHGASCSTTHLSPTASLRSKACRNDDRGVRADRKSVVLGKEGGGGGG